MTAPARLTAPHEPSEVGPDDFCRSCYGNGCESCRGRGHTVASRSDYWWPRSASLTPLRNGKEL